MINCGGDNISFLTLRTKSSELKESSMGLAIPVISARRLRRVIDEDCQGFLARFRTCSQEDTHQALDISIVRNSVLVLSKDLLRLLLDLEIESVIELLSSTAQCVIPAGLNGLNSAERTA